MTVNVARRRTRAARPVDDHVAESPIAIGELEQTTFSCPGCSRPLALGAARCPGCRTRLVMRVEAKRASLFVGVGLTVGLLAGGGLAAMTYALGQPARDANIAAAAAAAAIANLPDRVTRSQAPIASAGAGSSTGNGSGTGAGSGSGTAAVSGLTRSAIGQAAAIDARLLTSAVALETALAAPEFDSIAVSQILRTMSADAVYGLQLTTHIGAWSAGGALSDELSGFYTSVQETAAEGLTASIRNEAAYEAAATAMLTLLASLDDVDASVREAAADAGVALP